jgi:hypothetical protein
MPQLLEIKEIENAVWVRVGVPGEFPSGVTLWTPDEVKKFRNNTVKECVRLLTEELVS